MPVRTIESAGEHRLNTQSINNLKKRLSRIIIGCGPIEC